MKPAALALSALTMGLMPPGGFPVSRKGLNPKHRASKARRKMRKAQHEARKLQRPLK